MQIDSITVVIKPTNACNLRCSYCYNTYDQYSSHKMDLHIYNYLISLLSEEYRNIQLIWHGGEPLLMGRAFFEQCFDIQQQASRDKGTIFKNAIQTNATLVDKAWCDMFKKHAIRVGISFDGPPFGLSGRNGSDQALKAVSLLKQESVSFGAIAVINSQNIRFIDQIYDYFVSENIPVNLNCVFNAGNVKLSDMPLLVTAQEYLDAFQHIYRRWVQEGKRVRVNPFDNILQALNGHPKTCESSGCMYRFLAIDSHGELFPCGRFSPQSVTMGNIQGYRTITDVFESSPYARLVEAAITRRKKCIKECEIYKFCNGGCNADAFFSGNTAENGHLQCQCYKNLLLYIKDQCAIL